MPFGYSDKIFPYPAVQYIPLSQYSNQSFPVNFNTKNITIDLYHANQTEKLNEKIARYTGRNINFKINDDQLALLIYQAKVHMVMYRGHEVVMVAKKNPDHLQIFKIKKEYFYKEKLYFNLYDGQTSERLAGIMTIIKKKS